MRFCYGDKNTIRILEEAEFWKRQESEHTNVIQEVVPDLESAFVERLNEFKEMFDTTEAMIVQRIQMVMNAKNCITPEMKHDVMQLIDLTMRQSQMFVEFLGEIISESAAVQGNTIAIVVINHIRRESEYYIGMAKAYLENKDQYS